MSPLSQSSRILSRLEGFSTKDAFGTGVLAVGPSAYDGKPVAVLFAPNSGNEKTANVAGLWVVPASLVFGRPNAGESYGKWILRILTVENQDASTCGQCPHGSRFNGTCYTWGSVLCKGLQSMIKRLHRRQDAGLSIFTSMAMACRWLRATGQRLRNAMYGDQGAFRKFLDLPRLEAAAKSVLGYTHSQDKLTNPGRCMVSADNAQEAQAAYDAGLRSFRVVKDISEKLPFEIECPSAKVSCGQCGLCDQGKAVKSIAIEFHSFNPAKVRQFHALPVVANV